MDRDRGRAWAEMDVQASNLPPGLAQALTSAGARSGVDFDYLLQTAIRESSLNPRARAPTSSAVGLFQFIESTWLDVMRTEGPRLGYERYAAHIERASDGRFVVRDPQARQQILALREDPQIAADLAAAFTRRNGDYLAERFGRRPSAGELYIAHFLGASGAEQFFNAGLRNPDQIAANLFPRQAAANRAIFYDSGNPRTVREVYRVLVARHEGLPPAQNAAGFAAQQIASEPVLPSRYGPQEPLQMSFANMYATTNVQPSSAPAQMVTVDPGGALFAQLYGQ